MARPVVLVYQEFASVTTTPGTPDLNCLVVGPAYWIKDYLDDKGDIQTSSDYGTLNDNNPYTPPAAFTDAVVEAEPPGNKTGAILESASVKVYLDEARVLIVEDSDDTDVSTGADVTINQNVVTATGGTPVDFVTSGVQAGDYIVIEDPSGGGTDIVKRVLAVDSATALRTTTNFAATASTLLFRIERQVDDVLVDSSFVTVEGNQVTILGGITTTLTGESSPRTVQYAKTYIQYRSLRQDLSSVDTVSSETEITASVGKIDSRNPLAGVLATTLTNTTTPIQFYGLRTNDSSGHNECLDVIEGRKDIYAIVPLTTDKSILASYKTDVEGLASVTYAEQNGIPQKFRVVIGAQDMPTEKVISGPYTEGIHGCVSGAVAGTPIASADDATVFVDTSATFVTDGVRAGDKLVIVSDTAGDSRAGEYTVAEVYDENRLRTSTAFPTPAVPNDFAKIQGNIQYYILRGTGTPVAGTSFTLGDSTAATSNVTMPSITATAGMVGNVMVITAPAGNAGNWLITALNAAGPPGDVDVAHHSKSLVDDVGGTAGSQVSTVASVAVARQATTRRPFRVISDLSATFTTDSLKATDLLQVPNPVSGTNYTTISPYDYTVAYIPNENVVVLDSNTDVIGTNLEDGDTSLNFRVSRTLSKDDIVDELVTLAQTFNSRRVVLVWPDSVDVNGLVDGSKDRTDASTAEAADAQPGYYLAGVVGGMTSGLPPHQGFTNLGIAGIDLLYHSTGYFKDSQLTEISDGGWFVFGQESPNALPACIHQLTTDADTLETGEYSIVKNFDYIALFFQGILDDYLGPYNISDETLGFLREAMQTGIDLLKLRKYAKIGAPLNAASITSLGVHTTIQDRAEAYMSISMPKPLNRIGLHLISS